MAALLTADGIGSQDQSLGAQLAGQVTICREAPGSVGTDTELK
jgi:hypothetical protein